MIEEIIFQIFIKHFELCPASFSKLKLFQTFDLNLTPPQICSQHFVGPPRDNEMKFFRIEKQE